MPKVHFNKLSQLFDPERSECDNAVVAKAVDPDRTIFDFHINGEIEDPINCLSQLCSNAVDGLDGNHPRVSDHYMNVRVHSVWSLELLDGLVQGINTELSFPCFQFPMFSIAQ